MSKLREAAEAIRDEYFDAKEVSQASLEKLFLALAEEESDEPVPDAAESVAPMPVG